MINERAYIESIREEILRMLFLLLFGKEKENKKVSAAIRRMEDFSYRFVCTERRGEYVRENDLERASRILRKEFGSDWKKIVQTLGTKELTQCVGQELTSFMAFPEREKGGSSKWRGNCSPQVVEKLLRFVIKSGQYGKKEEFLLLDPMSGSGTSQDVAERLHMNVSY